MRTETCFNQDWQYCAEDRPELSAPETTVRGLQDVTLPHNNAALPANCFTEKATQFVSWYRKHFTLPKAFAGQRIFLEFAGVMMSAEVYVNGRKLLTHRGGYVPFSVDITAVALCGGRRRNVVSVRVDSRLQKGIPPCGHVMDYLPFGGIYRDVRLRAVPPTHIADVFVQTPAPLAELKTVLAQVTVAGPDPDVAARLSLLDAAGAVLAVSAPMPLAADTATCNPVLTALPGLELWDLATPTLYTARVELLSAGRVADAVATRFGFRQAEFTKEGPFLLNGRPLKLIGQNRHQTYPYIGAAAPARLQRRDADILRYEQGNNVVRTSHYPQSPHFLERCDEIGLLVFEEVPGWGHIGGAAWQKLLCRDVAAMIRRDRNHPSIILWGVRVNESRDEHDLYAETNRIARALDPTRQTGGVRWGLGSEFLEDVYTTNDYAYGRDGKIINEPQVTPYLITEYVGCVVSCRHTDTGEQMVRHALAHAEIVNAALGHPKVAGAIGWCAFDYHSQDWISVDGVQPWGVYDLFRCPKLAAAFYASQRDPKDHPVLQAATRWKVGDQAGFDPNVNLMTTGHNAPLVVFSNCDRVVVYIGAEKKGEYRPARDRFPHLPHPPFFCTGLGTAWGPSWQELRIVGYRGRRRVAEQRFPADHDARTLAMTVDDPELIADGADMTRVVLSHTDRYGNVQAFTRAVATLTVDGPASIVGPNPCSLATGYGSVYLRAGREPGLVRLRARAEGLGEQEVQVCIRPEQTAD